MIADVGVIESLAHESCRPIVTDPFADSDNDVLGLRVEWFVLHTRSRQEKVIAEHLERMAIRHFLPMVKVERRYAHRRRLVFKPIFPSYVFMRGTWDDRARALSTNRIARVIEAPDQTRLIHELRQIHAALAAGVTLDPYPYLRVGHRVRVRSGPLMGLEGLVEERRKPHRLVLQVQTLGRALSLELDADLLEPTD